MTSTRQSLKAETVDYATVYLYDQPTADKEDWGVRILASTKQRLGSARQGKARQGKANEGSARLGKARQGKARKGKARLGKGSVTTEAGGSRG